MSRSLHYHNSIMNRCTSPQYQEQSPTIPSKAVKELPHDCRVQNPIDYLAAPKRKREDSIDLISASRQQDSDNEQDDDDFVFPLQKRSISSTRALSAFCTASYDSERRDGPAEDDVHDEETEALVKKFRTSIFRQEHRETEPSSPSASSTSTTLSRPWSPIAKEDEGHDFFELPSIQRATTICESSDGSVYSCDPPEISSRPASPDNLGEELDQSHNWSCAPLFEYSRHEEKDPILEARRERPEWLSSPPSSIGSSQPSPLWNMSSDTKQPFWPQAWTGTFHQGSA